MTPDEIRALAAALKEAATAGPDLGTIIAAVASTVSTLLVAILAWLAKRQVDRIDKLEQLAQTKEACATTHRAFRDELDRNQKVRDDAARKAAQEMTGALKLVDRALDLLAGRRRGRDDP